MGRNYNYVKKILDAQSPQVIDEMLNNMGVVEPTKRRMTHQLVENTKNWMLSEEFTRSDDVVGLTPAFIPMVVRIMPGLIAPEIAGTQVLNTPTGLVWGWRTYLQGKDDSYESGKLTASFTNGCAIVLSAEPKTGATDDVRISTPGSVTSYTLSRGGIATAQVANVLHAEADNKAILIRLTAGEVANIAVGDVLTQGSTDYSVTAIYKNDDKDVIFNYIFKNYTGPDSTANLEGNAGLDNINRMGVHLVSTTATAKTRKLRVDFSFEAMQDALSLYNYDLQTELIKMAIKQIALEIDNEILQKIKGLANQNNVATFDFNTVSGIDPMGKIQALLLSINKAAIDIVQDTRLGMGNVIITNSRGLSLLSILPIFERSADYNSLGTSIQKAGVLGGTYKVFLDVYSNEDAIYVGYKGATESEAGVIYAPYTPIQVKSVVGTETFNNHNLFYTRYALVDNLYGAKKFYRKIRLANLGF